MIELARVAVGDLAPLDADDWLSAFRAFAESATALSGDLAPLRVGKAASSGLRTAAEAATSTRVRDDADARAFFVARFDAFRVGERGSGFVTGYYEPCVEASEVRAPGFEAPLLRRPADLGPRDPYPTRAEIMESGGDALLWLRDDVEVFFLHVQGSGRATLPDGSTRKLIYDGRNGRPYTSIGRIAVENGWIAQQDMSLARMKAWLRDAGLKKGEPGRALMERNESYIFFRAEPADDSGPIGGAGLPLTPLRSIAVDRTLWPYGTPFFLSADLPWRGPAPAPFRRPMIALDTGSAILGAARADLYFGSGDAAGARAGDIRHRADFVVLLPKGETPT